MVVVPETGGKFVTSSGVEKKKPSLRRHSPPEARCNRTNEWYLQRNTSFFLVDISGHSVLVSSRSLVGTIWRRHVRASSSAFSKEEY
jgi:hypothetical protein